MSFQVGVAKHGNGRGFAETKSFYLKSAYDKGGTNGDNIFRVMPPVHSLAAQGKYYQFHAVHKGFVGTDGRPRWFSCTEEWDYKTKEIKSRCPVCDKYRQMDGHLKVAKERGLDKEKIEEFRLLQVDPFKVEKRYYINALNQANEIGSLALPTKSFRALKELCDKYANNGVDLTSTKSVFLNFGKRSQYKGDNQALYPVEPFRKSEMVNGLIQESMVPHEITNEILNRMEKECVDLSKMFPTVSIENLDALVSAEGEDRKKIVDRVFAKGEPKEEQANKPLEQSVAGTNAVSVGRVELSQGGVTAVMPDLTSASVAKQSASEVLSSAKSSTPAVVAKMSATDMSAIIGAPTSANKTSTMSDSDFEKMFGK